MIVAVRDVPLAYVDVWHETDENGQPTCRQGKNPYATYRTVSVDELPEHITQCDYCSGEYTPTNNFRKGTWARKLDEADATEVLGK